MALQVDDHILVGYILVDPEEAEYHNAGCVDCALDLAVSSVGEDHHTAGHAGYIWGLDWAKREEVACLAAPDVLSSAAAASYLFETVSSLYSTAQSSVRGEM